MNRLIERILKGDFKKHFVGDKYEIAKRDIYF